MRYATHISGRLQMNSQRWRRRRARFTALLVLALAVLLLSVSDVQAQGMIIDPPGPPHPEPPAGRSLPQSIQVDAVQVAVEVDGAQITVRVRQDFRNQSDRPVEGQFVMPVPAHAAVQDFQMRMGDSILEGKMLTAQEARAIYMETVRRQRDPALLQYVGDNLLQSNVFPIPAGATRTVQVTYSHLVGLEDGLNFLRLPLFASGAGAPREQARASAPAPVEIDVELVNQPGLGVLYSPNTGVSIQRLSDSQAEIHYQASPDQAETRFELFWATSGDEIGVNLLSYQPVEEEGYFSLLVAPNVESEAREVAARDVVVVLDVSGSMEGEKIQQARDAASYIVEHMNPGDRLNLISFSTGVRRWQEGLVAIDQIDQRNALDWIETLEAEGSTDINRALLEALHLVQAGEGGADERGNSRDAAGMDRPAYVLFLTDGLPTQGETAPRRIVDNALNNRDSEQTLRLFTFGVGYDVNTVMLDTLSKELGGRSSYVLPEERIDEAVSSFYQSISKPVLTNVSLNFEGGGVVDELYPYPIPDLFAGEQIVVAGRYREGGDVAVELSGIVNNREVTYRYEDLGFRSNGGEPFVARVWATRKLGVLMEQVRRDGPTEEVVDAIVDLSLRYGIVSPYTAYLVEDPAGQAMEGGQPSSDQAMPMPRDEGGDSASPAGAAPASAAAEAEGYAEDAAARAAAMPASGEEAVSASVAQNTMQEATTVENRTAVRYLEGKTFVQQGWTTTADGETTPLWVDTAYTETMEMSWLVFGSDEYFALADDPQMAEWLSLGPEMVIVTGDGQAVRVSTSEENPVGQESIQAPVSPLDTPESEQGTVATPSQPSAGQPADPEGNFWAELWRWLNR